MVRFTRKASSPGKQRFAKVAVLSGAVFFALGLSQPACDAYYYPYYFRGFSSLLYGLRYASYPLLGVGGPYSAWTTARPYRLLTGTRLTGYPYMYGPQMLQNYSDEEPLNSPRKRVKQQRLGQEFGVDEVAHAQWADDEQDARLQGLSPQAVPPQGGYVQGATPGQLQMVPQQGFVPGGTQLSPNGMPLIANGVPQNSQFGVPQPALDGTPPLPPQMVSKSPVALAPNARNAAPGAVRTPLADGFINLVNTRFQGDIEKALFDPETRGWAKMLGLVSDDSLFGMDFTDTRVELIRQIFADSSLDSISKLGAIKILLNGGANRAKP